MDISQSTYSLQTEAHKEMTMAIPFSGHQVNQGISKRKQCMLMQCYRRLDVHAVTKNVHVLFSSSTVHIKSFYFQKIGKVLMASTSLLDDASTIFPMMACNNVTTVTNFAPSWCWTMHSMKCWLNCKHSYLFLYCSEKEVSLC